MGQLVVSGGADGIEAVLADLTTLARVLTAAGEAVGHCAAAVGAAQQRFTDGQCLTGTALLRASATLGEELDGPVTDLRAVAAALHDLACAVGGAVARYELVEQLGGSSWSSLGHLLDAGLHGSLTLLLTGNPSRALQSAVTADPGLVDGAVGLLQLRGEAAIAASFCTDGHAVVEPLYSDLDPVATTPPRGIRDLVGELALRDAGQDGEVSVSFVDDADGSRRAIVDIPGTKSWNPLHTSDVTSLATNLRALNGATTSYEQGVLAAMRAAGVTSTDEVMLVGHSEGGMVAVAAARDAVSSGQFRVTHVVTAGAPIAQSVGSLPPSVQVLAMEGTGDLVPHLDGAPNPASRNVTTVTGGANHGLVGANHDLDKTYLDLAGEVDASRDPSIDAFEQSASGFFRGEWMGTERYLITRRY